MGVIKRNGVWYAKWKTYEGKWTRQRTDARTKAEAKLIADELSLNVDRQKKGLDAHPMEFGLTIWGLCDWWLNRHAKNRTQQKGRHFLAKHIGRGELGKLKLSRARAPLFEECFADMERAGYKPTTINLLRRILIGVFTKAEKAGKWAGANPVKGTQPLAAPKFPRPVLKQEEVAAIIASVPDYWRGFFATALYLGLRKGEICGLLKVDYDPVRRTLFVGRSYDKLETKGKRVDSLPVTDALAPFLAVALKSPGVVMFPRKNGRMRPEHCNPTAVLRRALKKQGLIEGWLHKCRKCKSKGLETKPVAAPDAELRRCERVGCNAKLWPVAVPRAMRFHDLRHTAATHLLQAGVPVQHVQRILRHASITITVDTYGHLLTEDLRPALEKLGPQQVRPLSLRQLNQPK